MVAFDLPFLTGPLTEIDTQDYLSERYMKMVPLTEGRMLVVWTRMLEDVRPTGDIYARIVGADGQPQGEAFLVTQTTLYEQTAPYAAALPDGGFVISWSSLGQFPRRDPPYYDYHFTPLFRRFDAAGNPVEDEQVLPKDPYAGWEVARDVLVLKDGAYAVTSTSGRHYQVQFVDPDGNRLGDPRPLDAGPFKGNIAKDVGAIALETGRMLSWTTFSTTSTFNPKKHVNAPAVLTLYDSDGTVLRTTTFTAKVRHEELRMEVTALDNGGFVVNWGVHSPDRDADLRHGLQFFNANGKPVTSAFDPNQPGEWSSVEKVLVLSDGRVAVFSNATSDRDVEGDRYMALYDSDGTELMARKRVPELGKLTAADPLHVIALDDGNILLWDVDYPRMTGRILTPEGEASRDVIDMGYWPYSDTDWNVVLSNTGILYVWHLIEEGVFDGKGGLSLARFDFLPDKMLKGPLTAGDDAIWLQNGGQHDAGAGDDRVLLSPDDTTLSGGLGDDLLIGAGGRHAIYGGQGNDTLDGSHTIAGQIERTRLYGGAGDDLIRVGLHRESADPRKAIAYGGAGDDRIVSSEVMHDFPDTVWQSGQFYGGAGNDYIEASGSKYGGAGDDTLSGSGPIMDGGSGQDIAVMGEWSFIGGSLPSHFIWNFDLEATSIGPTNHQMFRSIEAHVAIGTVLARMLGDSADNVFFSATADDLLVGRDGNDLLSSGPGWDKLFGGAGRDTLDGGDDDDRLTGGAGADSIDGGDGLDLLDFSTDRRPVGVDLTEGRGLAGTAAGDSYFGIEGVIGGRGNDRFTGSDGNDLLAGLGGDDRIDGRGGDDFLVGGKGDDTLVGGAGVDCAAFSTKDDMMVDLGARGLAIGEGRDRLSGIEQVITGGGNDRIIGSAADNLLSGRAGDDTMTGGAGADVFFFEAETGSDVIRDYEPGVDLLNIYWFGVPTLDFLVFEESDKGLWISAETQYISARIFLAGIEREDLSARDFVFDTRLQPSFVFYLQY